MKKKLAVVAALMLACSISLPAQVPNHDLKSGKKHIRSIVLMPMVVDLVKVGLKGAEPMREEAHKAELPLLLEMDAVLRDLGYRLDAQSLSNETLAKDTDQRYTVDDLQKKFDAELKLMHRKSNGVRKGRFTLSDEVAKLPLSDNVDALLFVRAHGRILTGNKSAFNIAISTPGRDSISLDFGLVDAKTGEVLYFAKSTIWANISNSEEISAGITKAFSNLPTVSSSPAPSGQGAVATAMNAATPKSTNPQETANASLPSANAPGTGIGIQRIPLSQKVLKGMISKKVMPEYPGTASMNHIEGEVSMRIVIDRNGQVIECKDLSGPVALTSAASSAVKQWRYRPFTVNGQTFEVETSVTLTFKLSE